MGTTWATCPCLGKLPCRAWMAVTGIHELELFDLNSLVVFGAIVQPKTLTRASRRPGMSQPAVRHSSGASAVSVQGRSVRAYAGGHASVSSGGAHGWARLRELQVTVESDEFDPLQALRSFTLTANNYGARAVVPGLVRRLAKSAPSVVLVEQVQSSARSHLDWFWTRDTAVGGDMPQAETVGDRRQYHCPIP
jgi:hypothetical protein